MITIKKVAQVWVNWKKEWAVFSKDKHVYAKGLRMYNLVAKKTCNEHGFYSVKTARGLITANTVLGKNAVFVYEQFLSFLSKYRPS
ncbi:MAG: hypothetical protein Q8O88_06260 [bacterium]|nr:hypothetical protein [bacterium]